jgi:hypothetical protein
MLRLEEYVPSQTNGELPESPPEERKNIWKRRKDQGHEGKRNSIKSSLL